jgi:biopolymer transport protein ExbB/TolQ
MDLGHLGTIILSIVAGTSVLIAAVIGFRHTALITEWSRAAEAWRQERDAEVAKSKRLELEVQRLKTKVEELELKPDLRSMELLIERNEERAQERHERLLLALEKIAERLA